MWRAAKDGPFMARADGEWWKVKELQRIQKTWMEASLLSSSAKRRFSALGALPLPVGAGPLLLEPLVLELLLLLLLLLPGCLAGLSRVDLSPPAGVVADFTDDFFPPA